MLFFMLVQDAAPERATQAKIDEDLFARIGMDDPMALEELFISTHRVINTFVLSIVKQPEDTADIVQDTYIKIRECAHLYRPEGKPLAWMFTIARNLALSHLRKNSRESYEEVETIENSAKYSYVTDDTDRLVLSAALEILKEDERQIVLLHIVSGMKHKEIASNLNQPLSTVLSRYNRALKKLKTHLVAQGVSR